MDGYGHIVDCLLLSCDRGVSRAIERTPIDESACARRSSSGRFWEHAEGLEVLPLTTDCPRFHVLAGVLEVAMNGL